MQISDDDLLQKYPLSYNDVCKRCKESIDGFGQNGLFNEIMKTLKQQSSLAVQRKHNPKKPNSSCTVFYAEEIIGEIEKRYHSQG
jgi:hypothetical protein